MGQTKNLKVSVIVTTKNEEKNIGRFLESVKEQTYKNLEIIVVDNNSLDKTKKIAKKYTSKVYNKGPERSAQRNFGAEKASGTYIIILDADMELTSRVVEDCIEIANSKNYKVLVIPERTTGQGYISKVRQFEREMYMGDLTIEVARFFEKKVFFKFGGYDLNLTGPEDYDLPYRISKKYEIGRSNEYILHHEGCLTLKKLLYKKFYYASMGSVYARKHPELIWVQGNLLFRKAYLRNWKKFILHPFLGSTFLFIKFLETIWAVSGFISSVGILGFIRVVISSFK